MGALADAHALLTLLGFFTSAISHFLPCITTIADICRHRSVGNRSALPYIAKLISCILLAVYAVWPKDSNLSSLINIIGIGTQAYCLVKYLTYCTDVYRHWCYVCLVSATVFLVSIIALYLSDVEGNLAFFSWTCAICRIVPAIVPLLNVGTAVRENNMRSMPSVLSCGIALANAILSIGVACTGTRSDGSVPEVDSFLLYPSLVAFGSGVVQISLHIRLRLLLQHQE